MNVFVNDVHWTGIGTSRRTKGLVTGLKGDGCRCRKTDSHSRPVTSDETVCTFWSSRSLNSGDRVRSREGSTLLGLVDEKRRKVPKGRPSTRSTDVTIVWELLDGQKKKSERVWRQPQRKVHLLDHVMMKRDSD